MGIEYIATGHYANAVFDADKNKFLLKKAMAVQKDQTYVLYNLMQNILKRTIFPLGRFSSKDEIRKIASEMKIDIENKKDSQEICFIPDNDYVSYIQKSGVLSEPGNIVDTNGRILGKHDGLIKYTIGQRKGIGISAQKPLFVIGLDMDKNELIVGEEEMVYKSELIAEDVNYIFYDEIPDSFECYAKIRYASKPSKCKVFSQDNNKVKVIFEEPQRAVTPGQSVVFYDNDIVIGRGCHIALTADICRSMVRLVCF